MDTYLSLGLALEGDNPGLLDIVGYIGEVPVNRVTVLGAEVRIGRAMEPLRDRDAVVSQMIITSSDIRFGLKTAHGKIPASLDGVWGKPYLINFGFPLTTVDLFTMLSDDGEVFTRFRDLVIACLGIRSFEDYYPTEDLVSLYALREGLYHGFSDAIVRWYDRRTKKKG